MNRFDLSWYIVLTPQAVREIIPEYVPEGTGPYLIILMGEKGSMVWPLELVKDIMQGYITAHEKLQEMKDEYEHEVDMDDTGTGEANRQDSKSVLAA